MVKESGKDNLTITIVADENVDREIVTRLRESGFSIVYIAENNAGISDDEVLEQASSRHAILLTADKDFGEMVFQRRLISEGVILFRLAGLSAQSKAQLIEAVLSDHEIELYGAFTVISPGLVRIRQRID